MDKKCCRGTYVSEGRSCTGSSRAGEELPMAEKAGLGRGWGEKDKSGDKEIGVG